MSVGQRIKNRRKELEMTVDEVANKLGKNRATIYRYESDEIENLPITVLEPLARILRVTPAYLMGWEDESVLLEREYDSFDAKLYFRGVLRNLINLFGYEVTEIFGKDKKGNFRILLKNEKEAFEIKEDDFNSFFGNCYSFIDYEFNKMIKEENRVKTVKEQENKPYLLPNAAHEIDGASEEDKAHDDAIMDDDDF